MVPSSADTRPVSRNGRKDRVLLAAARAHRSPYRRCVARDLAVSRSRRQSSPARHLRHIIQSVMTRSGRWSSICASALGASCAVSTSCLRATGAWPFPASASCSSSMTMITATRATCRDRHCAQRDAAVLENRELADRLIVPGSRGNLGHRRSAGCRCRRAPRTAITETF